jgi:hypothetical protein
MHADECGKAARTCLQIKSIGFTRCRTAARAANSDERLPIVCCLHAGGTL